MSEERRRKAFTAPTFNRIFAKDKGHCRLCGLPVIEQYDACLDHIHPLALDGSDVDDNLQLTHRRCNLLKRVRTNTQSVSVDHLPDLPPDHPAFRWRKSVTLYHTDDGLWHQARMAALAEHQTIGAWLNQAITEKLGRGTMTTTTIRDAYQHLLELEPGSERTMEQLRDYIQEKGLRYEQLDDAFWTELFEGDWLLGEIPYSDPADVLDPAVTQIWQHNPSGEKYAVSLQDGDLRAACGPLYHKDVDEALADLEAFEFDNDPELLPWVTANQDAFTLVESI